MGKSKVLVKVHPEGKYVVDIDKSIDAGKLTPGARAAWRAFGARPAALGGQPAAAGQLQVVAHAQTQPCHRPAAGSGAAAAGREASHLLAALQHLRAGAAQTSDPGPKPLPPAPKHRRRPSAGARVALRSDSYTLHILLPTKVDPLVSLMKVEKVPDSTYDMIGGLDQQIKEIKEVRLGGEECSRAEFWGAWPNHPPPRPPVPPPPSSKQRNSERSLSCR
jgi:hypothetical protein